MARTTTRRSPASKKTSTTKTTKKTPTKTTSTPVATTVSVPNLSSIQKKGSLFLLKFYLLFLSLVSVIGMAVAYGIAIHQTITYSWITDQEYLMTDWSVRNAESECRRDYNRPQVDGNTAERSIGDQLECQEEKRLYALMSRSLNYKEAVMGGLVWGTIFLILFLAHYPAFRRMVPRDE